MRGREIYTEREAGKREGSEEAALELDVDRGGWKDIPSWGKSMLGKDEVF